MSCVRCGSYAINPLSHGRSESDDLDLCDVCYWRKRAELAAEYPLVRGTVLECLVIVDIEKDGEWQALHSLSADTNEAEIRLLPDSGNVTGVRVRRSVVVNRKIRKGVRK